ncbi:hypothetical protein [Prevotellamassilia timonensis]|uniref:hypothetical protein n=1 Tax=Prevotellamassilia timonensis TaxID=1852370 RepID=UPI0012B5DA5C|nr:hypothetical protein [Prevotellamassilia timonensis]
MKMTYSKPQAQVINLYAEDTMLAGSGNVSYDVDKTKETNVIMSDQKGWSSDSWSADED